MSLEELFAKIKAQRAPEPTGPVEWLIVGLGNPGKEYAATRHNIGFITLDRLAQQEHFDIKKIKFKSLVCDTVFAGKRCMMMKPSTFMNNSGEAVGECARFYKIPPEHILVIYDDINFDPGVMRIRKKGSDGGHNGLKSIIYQLQSDAFTRIKIGVGAPPVHYDMADWVLGRFSKEEIAQLEKLVDCVVEDVVPEIMKNGAESAMNQYNGKVF